MREEWQFQQITDYWDNSRINSIYVHSQAIGRCGEEERGQIYQSIKEWLDRYLGLLSGRQLCQLAFVVCDQIYQSANRLPEYNFYVAEYLQKTAGVLFQRFHGQGFSLHYLVNNVFSELKRPMFLMKHCFMPAGIRYLCPLEFAKLLMKKEGIPEGEYLSSLPRYLDQGMDLCQQAAQELDRKSYVLLLPDGSEEEFRTTLDQIGNPGVVTAFRDQAPVPGSQCRIWMPDQR